MGEGALPGGIFRKSAPGELEFNIPGVVESTVNKIIRQAYNGDQKGEPTKLRGNQVLTDVDDKLYPRGFTPPEAFRTLDSASKTYKQDGPNGEELEIEAGIFPNLSTKVENQLAYRYIRYQESNLLNFDSATLQFKHLLEYHDTSKNVDYRNPLVDGKDGIRPGLSFKFDKSSRKMVSESYLASFVRTHRENEDPTLLGFDLNVRLSNSPLFNGSLESFLILEGKEKGNIELENRIPLLKEFQKQFLNFFKAYDPNHLAENLPSVGHFMNDAGVIEKGKQIVPIGNEPSGNLTNFLFSQAVQQGKADQTLGPANSRPIDPGRDMTETFLGSAVKAYYVQSISGLGKLNESNDFGESSSQRFVKWQSDYLTVTVNEDVSQNMGYLASLYKNLAWSRERGRLAVPENLLRFEVVLDITEIRNYLRAYQGSVETTPDSNTADINTDKEVDWIQIADQTSKYRYFIHECQLFFPAMPHGDTLTNAPSGDSFVKGLDMKIYFKNSNLRFMKFLAPLNAKIKDNDYSRYTERYTKNDLDATDDYFRVKVVDNSVSFKSKDGKPDTTLKGGNSSVPRDTIFSDGTDATQATVKNTSPITYPVEIFKKFNDQQIDNTNESNLSDLERRRLINQQPTFVDALKVGAKQMAKNIAKAALGSAINLLNRSVLSVASLINRTLNQIYNSTPVVGGIKPPKSVYGFNAKTNIYEGTNDFEQAYIDFIGPGLRTFFQDPIKFRKEGFQGETLEEKIIRGRPNPGPRPGRNPKDYFELANQATPTNNNLKLKQIVDADPDLGNGFSGASQIPFLGNSADPGVNRTLKQIVDANPGIGNGFSGASSIPFLGNSADPGVNKTLKQIVDADPKLGIPGSLISTNPSLGNNAESGTNLTLNQMVEQSPSLGQPGSDIPTNPSLGNNAEPGVNLTLQTIVDKNPALGNPGSNIPHIPSQGNNATTTGKNLTLQQLVDNDPDFGNNAGITVVPYLGNNADLGDNVSNNQTVRDNSIVKNPFLGNSGELGNNTSNNITVELNTKVENPDEGNSANTGYNIENDRTVRENTTVIDAAEGNSAETGANVENDITVMTNTIVIDAEEGNSAINGDNIENDDLVEKESKVIDPELGNNAEVNKNIENSKLVQSQSKVSNPSLGNKGLVGNNITNDKLVKDKSDVINSGLGNGGQIGQNQRINDLIQQKSKVETPSEGNSGELGINTKTNELIKNQTSLTEPNLGNSGRLGVNNPNEVKIDGNSQLIDPQIGNGGEVRVNIDKDTLIRTKSDLDDASIGNSGRLGKNDKLNDKVDRVSNVDGTSVGNSGSLGYNFDKDVTVENFSGLNSPQVGNSGISGANLPQTSKVDQYSKLDESDLGNSASRGKTKTVDEIVEKQSELENSDLANRGTRGKNLNLSEFSKYSQSRVYGTVNWNNIQFPKSGQKFPPPTTEK